jgi:hypothetical protein
VAVRRDRSFLQVLSASKQDLLPNGLCRVYRQAQEGYLQLKCGCIDAVWLGQMQSGTNAWWAFSWWAPGGLLLLLLLLLICVVHLCARTAQSNVAHVWCSVVA